jgi:hypothetical protein
MNLLELWWTGVLRPGRAFEALRARPAPAWGFRVVLVFNLIISFTTILALLLLGRLPSRPVAVTFIAPEDYYRAEIFFLPVLRLAVWLLGAAVVHLGLRLAGRGSDFDRILNIEGLGYLVVMPFILLSDWIAIALGAYQPAVLTIGHGGVALLWGILLSVCGLRTLLGVRTGLALALTLVSSAFQIPLLAIFAR